MKLILKRIALKSTYTIGHLYYLDDKGKEVYICDTIEDKVRDLNKNGKFDNGEKKVMHQTAIPYGTYEVTLDVVSPKFSLKAWYKNNANGGRVPRLLKVPHFEGILMHCGVDENSSSGCIIVGFNKVVGKVINSQDAFLKLYDLLSKHKKEGIKIEIK